MITRVLYLSFVFAAIESVTGKELLGDLTPKKVVGGVEAVPHSHPYQVGLFIDEHFFCGGILITSEHILTAAHCVNGSRSIEVILGAHDILQFETTQKRSYNPTVIVNGGFLRNQQGYDIALLKLRSRVKYTKFIKPLRDLADEECGSFAGSSGLVLGWGHTSSSQTTIESSLRQVYVDILSPKKCNSYVSHDWLKSQMCSAGWDNMATAVGACFGDSGGPLLVGNTLVGIVSVGFLPCEAGLPTIYTRISVFRDWISKYAGI